MTDGDPDRSTLQAKDIPDLVFQIPLIGEVEEPGIVAENNEMGGLGAGLGHVVAQENGQLLQDAYFSFWFLKLPAAASVT